MMHDTFEGGKLGLCSIPISSPAHGKILWPAGRQILGAEGAPASVQIYDLWRPAIGDRIDFDIWCDPKKKKKSDHISE